MERTVKIMGPHGPIEGAAFWIGSDPSSPGHPFTLVNKISDKRGDVFFHDDRISENDVIRVRKASLLEVCIPIEMPVRFIFNSGPAIINMIKDEIYDISIAEEIDLEELW